MAALAVAALLTSRSSRARQATYVSILIALFVLSHALADPVGTWAAIAVVTVAAGAAAFRTLQPAAPGS